uniref:Acidic leucine-rich nuclear phosphoprotein 32 family member n=1 Tax=Neogobius melanostomus TaxID=47308 RepID=A0A8C6WVU5_9GOBI
MQCLGDAGVCRLCHFVLCVCVQVVELLLDSCLSADGELEGLSEDFSALEVLSLCNTGLKSLSKLPSLPKLKRLELSDNVLTSGLEVLAEKCPALSYLNLSGNSFKDLSAFKGLQKLSSLQSLDVDEDEEDEESWRERVFELLPQICFLNGFDQDHNQAPDDDGDYVEEDDDEEEDGGLFLGRALIRIRIGFIAIV